MNVLPVLLLAGLTGRTVPEEDLQTKPGPYKVEFTCRTNKSEYVLGEPIYVTVSVEVLPGSPPVPARWLLPAHGLNYDIASKQRGRDRQTHLEVLWEADAAPLGNPDPFELVPGERIWTTFEALYAHDFQVRSPYWPCVDPAAVYKCFMEPGEFPPHWGLLHPRPAEEPYQVVVTQYKPRYDDPVHFRLVALSNEFRIVPNPEPTPVTLFKFLMATQYEFRREGEPWFERSAKCYRLLAQDQVIPQLRAWGTHALLQTARRGRSWKSVIGYGVRLLDGFPGYPLQPEVEFDMATAYIVLVAESLFRQDLCEIPIDKK